MAGWRAHENIGVGEKVVGLDEGLGDIKGVGLPTILCCKAKRVRTSVAVGVAA